MFERAYSLLNIKSVDADRRVITGFATTPDLDRQGHSVDPKGVKFTNPLPLLLHHDKTQPVGTVVFDRPTAEGIKFTAQLPDIPEPGALRERVNEAWQSVKAGLIRGVSIGWLPIDGGIEFVRETGTVLLKKIEVFELSLVVIPANAAATILSVKSFDAPYLAPLGIGSDASTPKPTPAAVGTVRVSTRQDRSMKTIGEQITAFETERASVWAELESIQTKAIEENRGKEPEERDRSNDLKTRLKAIDDEISDLHEMQTLQLTKATPVTPQAVATPQAAAVVRSGFEGTIRVQQPQLPPGIGFARAVKSAVVARLDSRSMLDVAKQLYPSDTRLHGHITHVLNLPNIINNIKAAVPAGTTTQADWASALIDPTNLAGEFIEFLRPATILGKFGANGIPALRAVPFNVRMIEQTQGGTGYWVGQGAPKPLTAFGFSPVTLAFTKVAAISVITEELARFSSPSAEQLVRDGLRDALAERIDRDLIDPAEAGVANVQPASLTYGVTALSSAGTSADNARTDLAKLVAEFTNAEMDPAGLVIILPTTLALFLSFQVNALGQPEFPNLTMAGGSIKGIPVITTNYAANASGGGNLVIAVNAREVFLADDGQVTVDASREASLQMLDNPTNNSATATPTQMVSMWQTNSIALRAERFINWAKRRAGAVAYIDDVNWGSVGSPS